MSKSLLLGDFTCYIQVRSSIYYWLKQKKIGCPYFEPGTFNSVKPYTATKIHTSFGQCLQISNLIWGLKLVLLQL